MQEGERRKTWAGLGCAGPARVPRVFPVRGCPAGGGGYQARQGGIRVGEASGPSLPCLCLLERLQDKEGWPFHSQP